MDCGLIFGLINDDYFLRGMTTLILYPDSPPKERLGWILFFMMTHEGISAHGHCTRAYMIPAIPWSALWTWWVMVITKFCIGPKYSTSISPQSMSRVTSLPWVVCTLQMCWPTHTESLQLSYMYLENGVCLSLYFFRPFVVRQILGSLLSELGLFTLRQ